MTVYDLMAKITLDTSEYESGLTGASSKSNDFAGKLKSGLATAGKVGAAAIGAASTAIGFLGKIGLDYNSQMETYTTNFKVMLGSTEDAVAKVEELKTMAAKTPFGMADLADATQTLLSFQVPAEETTGILKQLGDISLGNSEKLSGLALVFGQVSSAGKLTGQDLTQFINQGFNPLNYIAERTGESMEELRDRMSKGAIGTEEIKQAFIDATSEGGQFFNGMEEGSKTTEGLISTLKDNISAKLGEAFQSVSNILKDELLPKAIEFVESIDVEKVVESVQGLIDAFINIAPLITAAATAMVTFKIATAISGIITTLSTAITTAGGAFAALGVAINAHPLVFIATVIAGVIAALVTLWATNEDFREAVSAIWDGIKATFAGAWEAIKNVWDGVKDFFGGVWEGIKATFEPAAGFFSGVFTTAWEWITIVWDVVGGYFENIWNTISGIFEVVGDVLSGDFEGAWEKIQEIVGGWVEYFQEIWDGITGVFSNAWEKFLEIGTNIVEGIKEGIANAWENFKNWVKEKFQGVVDGIKDLLGIQSPSRVFAGIGENMALGLGKGWEDEFSSIKDGIASEMDFGAAKMSAEYTVSGKSGSSGSFGGSSATQNPISLVFNLTSEIDGAVLARKMFTYNMSEGEVQGLSLAGTF